MRLRRACGEVKNKFKGKSGASYWLLVQTQLKLKLKLKLESTRSARVKQRIREQYKIKDQEGKRSAREDMRRWLNELEMTGNVERAAENGRTGELHRIVKTLTGEKRRASTAVRVKTEDSTKNHLKGLFSSMNWKEVKMIENSTLDHFDQPKSAIKAAKKNGKAAGLNNVVAELLNLDEITKELTKLFNKVKEEGVAPKSWNRGLIVKLPKKGELHECTD